MSPAEQEMDDCESLPEVSQHDACVTMEESDMNNSLVRTVTLNHCAFPQQLNLRRLL